MVHILEGVVDQPGGTAYHSGISAIGKPLAGKTGTTNDSKDTWFVGFSPDLVAAVFVGFDEPASLGYRESGATVAAPIFRDFMAEALKDKPATPFRVPPGIRLVRVNAMTGRPAQPGETNVIYEAFKPDTVPDGTLQEVLNNGRIPDALSDAAPPVDDAPIAVSDAPADNGGPLRATSSSPPNVTPPSVMPSAPATATPAAALPSARPANPDPQAGGLY
jgi:penicillin-binding protein 1A